MDISISSIIVLLLTHKEANNCQIQKANNCPEANSLKPDQCTIIFRGKTIQKNKSAKEISKTVAKWIRCIMRRVQGDNFTSKYM